MADGLRSVANAARARRAVARNGAVVLVRDLDEGVAAVNELAPEHVEVIARGASRLARRIVGGAVFVGPWTPVAVGDYGVGPNHVLPTGGAARFASPLSVRDFQRRHSVVTLTRDGLARRDRGRRARGHGRGLPRARPERPRAVRGGVMDPLRHVKPAVRAIAAYTLALREAPVKINQNENPWDLEDAVKRRVVETALRRPWSRYPDFDPKELLEALARFSGWREDGVLAGNGSNELIEALLLVTVGAGTRVVIPEPTFTLYALMTTILGGEAVRVPLSQPRRRRAGPRLRRRGPRARPPRVGRRGHDRLLAEQPDRQQPRPRRRRAAVPARATRSS